MRDAVLCLALLAVGCRSSSSAPDAGRPSPTPKAETQAAVDAALAKRQQGDSEGATAMLLEAAARAKAVGDVAGEAWALHRAGDTLLDQQRCGPARKRYLQALDLHQQLSDTAKLGLVANDLGLWAKRCEFEEAIGWFSVAMTYRRDDPKGFAVSANNLGGVFWNSARPEEAHLAYEAALEQAVRAGDFVLQRKVLANLALLWVLIAEGRYERDPLSEEHSIDDLIARAEATLAGDAGTARLSPDELLEELDQRRDRFKGDSAVPVPIPEGSPALAKARDYFRRAIDAAKRAGEDPLVVCSSLGTFGDRCEVLTPKTP